jgi:hypothetical protein
MGGNRWRRPRPYAGNPKFGSKALFRPGCRPYKKIMGGLWKFHILSLSWIYEDSQRQLKVFLYGRHPGLKKVRSILCLLIFAPQSSVVDDFDTSVSIVSVKYVLILSKLKFDAPLERNGAVFVCWWLKQKHWHSWGLHKLSACNSPRDKTALNVTIHGNQISFKLALRAVTLRGEWLT